MRATKHRKATLAPPPPACAVCTTPRRCGSSSWKTVKGPQCAGKANGPDLCGCLNDCGDDSWLIDGRSIPCDHLKARRAEAALQLRREQAIPQLVALARRVAALNPSSATIGAGMLASLVMDAESAIAPFDGSAS